MAKYIKVDGKIEQVEPSNGKAFTLDELRKFVGGTIDIQKDPRRNSDRSGSIMVVNDNGKLDGMPVNEEASKIWREWYPIEKYPHNNDEMIVGDVLMCSAKEMR